MINTPVEAEIPDLVPGTVYEIRVVIHDEDGNSYQGTDLPVLQVRTKCHGKYLFLSVIFINDVF